MVTRYHVDPDKKFQKAIDSASKAVDDLTIPFTLISKSWFQSNKFIFEVKSSSGKYADLSENYKDWKHGEVGFVYPVLKLRGNLGRSITDPKHEDAISLILNRKTLLLGTKNKVAAFHQHGTARMPARPPVLIGAEQTAPPELNRRLELWVQTLGNYVQQKAQGAFK